MGRSEKNKESSVVSKAALYCPHQLNLSTTFWRITE